MKQTMIQTNIQNRVGAIFLNRPEKRNALHPDMVGELTETIQSFQENDTVKIIVIRGKGDAFCAGADLSVIKALKSATYEENLHDSKHLATLFEAIYHCPKPVIAGVHGHAIAGGCGLATVCDLVVVSEAAKFGYTETRIGFVPAIVAQFLIRKIGETHARRLLLTGELISAKEAFSIGLVSHFATAENFEEALSDLIQTLLVKTSGQALQSTKKLINKVADSSHEEAIDYAIETNAKARSTDDCQRGISAFLNKEKIQW